MIEILFYPFLSLNILLMKNLFSLRRQVLVVLTVFGWLGGVHSLHGQSSLPIIPVPNKVQMHSGTLQWRPTVPDKAFRYSSDLRDSLALAIGAYTNAVTHARSSSSTSLTGKGSILFSLDKKIPNEGYVLHISTRGIKISASTKAGFFYAMQSLLMLAEDSGGSLSQESWSLPCLTIADSPRFPYRGLHIDTSRHFFDLDCLKKQIDNMARYKLNTFHWHFTDAGGWRAEVKKYPELTKYTAYRPYENYMTFWDNGRRYCVADAPAAQGGYYTQDQLREIVEYAKERNITVIPEIEMPGHSEEVLAVYPELSCTGKPYECGEFCPGKEATFEFLENVLDEMLEIFPSKYIHIGGDEADKKHWRTCPDCQKRMKDEGLKEVEQLQSYLIHRIEKYLLGKGRRIIGWDEILEGGLAPDATVMSWRGEEGGLTAARANHSVIMTPNGFLYFDYYQDIPHTQPSAMSGFVPLNKVYSYDPISTQLPASQHKYIKGCQANVWTEYIPTVSHLEYMIYPRILALSEISWSNPERKDFDRFRQRVILESSKLRARGYNPFDIEKEVGPRPESGEPVNHLARGAKVTYQVPYSSHYTAGGETALVDGKRGDWTHTDGRWQGSMRPVDFTIDLGKSIEIHSVEAMFMQEKGAWIHLPSRVTYSSSLDGKEFTPLQVFTHDVPVMKERLILKDFKWEGQRTARYIRVQAKQADRRGSWIFLDEVIVR